MRRPSARQLGTLAVALMIVLAGVPGGAVAQQECTKQDAAYAFAFGPFGVLSQTAECAASFFTTSAAEEVRDAETAQDEVDLYTAATAQAAQQDVYTSTVDNYLQDTDSIAWSKAEVAIAETFENGGTKAEAKTAAREAIAGYYTTKQKNLKESYNTSLLSLYYVQERAEQEGITGYEVLTTKTKRGIFNNPSKTPWPFLGESPSSNETVTFVNGTTGTVYSPSIGYENTNSVWTERNLALDTSISNHKSNFDDSYVAVVSQPPNANYDAQVVLNITAYVERWNRIETKNSELQGEAEQFVDAIWSDLEGGALNSSDVISRNTQLFEYGTRAANGSAGFYDTVGATAALGLQTPDLAETSSMTVEYKGQTYNGLLFARNVPGGSWSVGETYNTTNFDGPVILATVENGELVLDGEFTLTEARNKAGDPVGTVQTTRYNYQTADTSELNEQLDQLAELTGELQNRSDAAGGGGGGIGGDVGGFLEDIGTALGFGAGVGLIVVLVVAAVAARFFTA